MKDNQQLKINNMHSQSYYTSNFITFLLNGYIIQMINIVACEICDRQAIFQCGECQIANYCSRQHQVQHWRINHKQTCKTLYKHHEVLTEKDNERKRLLLRKQYFEAFSNKMYDECLHTVIKLVELQHNNLQTTRYINNQFQYGASITLLCRTYILLLDDESAKIQINRYIRNKKHFLEDLRDIPKYQQYKNSNKPLTNSSKEFFQKKLSLIAAVANILNNLQIICLEYYTIYTKHVEQFFGENSQQVSNCYYLIGCYYAQINSYSKAILCFSKAASLRTTKVGDCLLNLGILSKYQKKIPNAIQFLKMAIQVKQNQYNQGSIQVAEIHECLAHIYAQIQNFSEAVSQFQEALKIIANYDNPQRYNKINGQIKNLQEIIKKSVQQALQDQQANPDLYYNLKSSLSDKKWKQLNKGNENNQDQAISQLSDQKRKVPQLNDHRITGKQLSQKLFRVNESFLLKLKPIELFLLSELQLELESCRTQYAIAQKIGSSAFLKKLSIKRFTELKNQNQKLFQLINIQEIAK